MIFFELNNKIAFDILGPPQVFAVLYFYDTQHSRSWTLTIRNLITLRCWRQHSQPINVFGCLLPARRSKCEIKKKKSNGPLMRSERPPRRTCRDPWQSMSMSGVFITGVCATQNGQFFEKYTPNNICIVSAISTNVTLIRRKKTEIKYCVPGYFMWCISEGLFGAPIQCMEFEENFWLSSHRQTQGPKKKKR